MYLHADDGVDEEEKYDKQSNIGQRLQQTTLLHQSVSPAEPAKSLNEGRFFQHGVCDLRLIRYNNSEFVKIKDLFP